MAGILGDIDKTARAGAGCAEPCGIDVPVRVHLAGAHKGDVDPCAVVVEHLIRWLIIALRLRPIPKSTPPACCPP